MVVDQACTRAKLSRLCCLPTRVSCYFLNKLAKACLASVGAPEEVCRSTTVLEVNSSQVLLAVLFTIRFRIVLLHSKRAPGSKYVHCLQVCRSPRHFVQALVKPILASSFTPHAPHLDTSPKAIIFGERGPSRSRGACLPSCCCGFDRCGSRSLSM